MRNSKDIGYRQEAGGYSDKNIQRDKRKKERKKHFSFQLLLHYDQACFHAVCVFFLCFIMRKNWELNFWEEKIDSNHFS